MEEKCADLELLEHMERVGQSFLQERHSDSVANGETKIGFHAPGHNS